MPEWLSLSTRLLPNVGATNEIKTLASPPLANSTEYEAKNPSPTSEKIYVEEGSNLISLANVFKVYTSKSSTQVKKDFYEFISLTTGDYLQRGLD